MLLCKVLGRGLWVFGREEILLSSFFVSNLPPVLFNFFTDNNWMQAWTSLKAREVVSLGRELLGGNGILADFLVAKVRGTQRLLIFKTTLNISASCLTHFVL